MLEHIEDDRAALESWVARLRPGGTLLMSVPGFARRFAPADVMVGHFRRYDPPVLEELMRSVGLVDVEVRQYSGPLGYVLETARNPLGRRRLAQRGDESIEDRTAGSGRLFQPTSSPHAALAEHGTAPFRWLQDKGVGGGPGLLRSGPRRRAARRRRASARSGRRAAPSDPMISPVRSMKTVLVAIRTGCATTS